MTRTAIIFESDIDYMRLFVVDGDWSHLDRRCIGLFSPIERDVEPETVLIDADRKLENFMYESKLFATVLFLFIARRPADA